MLKFNIHIYPSLVMLFSISFLLYFKAQGQEKILYDQFTSENGLSENVVYCIHQDKQGFIWVGTDYGLNRFDGYHFKQYHRVNTDTTTLSGQSILCISEDVQGKLWIGALGLNYFDPETGKVERIHMPGKGLNYSVTDIYNLGNGNLFLASVGTDVYIFNIEHRSFTQLSLPEFYGSVSFSTFKFPGDRIGTLISGGGDIARMAMLNTGQDSLECRTIQEVLPFALERKLDYYFLDNKGNHYLSSRYDNTFRVYDHNGRMVISSDSFLLNTKTPLHVFCIAQVDAQHVWIGSNLGLIIYDIQTEKITFPELIGDSNSLPGNKEIRDILCDRNGNVWIGVFGEGLLKCDNRTIPFRHLTLPEITQKKLTRMIFGLHAWPDNVVAAETNYYNFSLIKDRKPAGVISTDDLSLDAIVQIATGKSLSELSSFQERFFRTKLEELKDSFPFGAFLPNDTTVVYYHFWFSVNTPRWNKNVINELVKNVVEDDNYYWAATGGGLHRIDKKTYTDTVYRFEAGNPYSLSESTLYYIVADTEKNLWIGTKGGGLNYFDRKQNKFFHYTTEHGLPDNVVYFILPDKNGNLWLTTNKGISRFDPREKTFSNFTRRDGLLNTEFNTLGGVMMQDGYMYFSGTSGIDYFIPGEVESVRKAEAVYLSEWMANDQNLQIAQPVSLGYDQNHITLRFTTNDFVRPDLVYFRYRMHTDEPWARVQGVNFASYNALHPGTFDFEVQASYDNLHWSESAMQQFTIRTPWWRSWWFRALCLVAVLSGLYVFYRYRIEQLKRLQRIRTKISRDLHDEVGSTLSSIHVYSSVATKAMQTNPEATKDALKQIRQNSREVMENMSDIVWAINTSQNGQMSLEDKLKNYGYELLTPLGINCLYDIDKEAEKRLVNIEARKNVLLIAKEAMNNIAKYSSATEASFQLGITNGNLQLRIRDNGKGFDPTNNRNGNGLFNMRQRTESLGGRFQLDTAEAHGTTLQCQIPLTSISDTWIGDHT